MQLGTSGHLNGRVLPILGRTEQTPARPRTAALALTRPRVHAAPVCAERRTVPLTVSRRLRLALTAALLVSLAGLGGAATAAPDPNVITRSGSTLMLHGHAYRFTGVNAYELGTFWSINAGCGPQLTTAQLDSFFASLRPDSVVRFWAFQAQGVNKSTRRLDYTGLD